ncbi:hypothetical protein KW795_01900 [Candidatus Microgenomates bacterium]|nr:hypothetical protein [Candidatus Microgenomates bacterium]
MAERPTAIFGYPIPATNQRLSVFIPKDCEICIHDAKYILNGLPWSDLRSAKYVNFVPAPSGHATVELINPNPGEFFYKRI